MTNAEMYQAVFGFIPDKASCPTECCAFCPVNPCEANGPAAKLDWWDKEYKGNGTVKVEIIEHHTFAKPDDVSNIDFPSVSSEDK